MLVDTLGVVLQAIVHPANMQDREGGMLLLTALADRFPLLKKLFADAAYRGPQFRGAAPARVHVTVRRTEGGWEFAVRDQGIGLDPAQSERIFQVFQRLHPRSAYPGTGMGLAICKRIIEQYGGRLWVDSRPGAGATFFLHTGAGVPARRRDGSTQKEQAT